MVEIISDQAINLNNHESSTMDIEEIIKELDRLHEKNRELEIPEEERTALVKQMGDYANNFIGRLNKVDAFSEKRPTSLSITGKKKSLQEILQIYQTEVAETGINAASGKHFGYIPAGGIFSTAIADFIAAITNPYAGVYYAAPGAAGIENEIIQWLKSVFSFPLTAVGTLTSGGSISAQIALTAARDKHAVKGEKIARSVVYLSEQVHQSVQKALRIIGLEDVIMRLIPLDEHHRMKASALEDQIQKDVEQNLHPFLIVGTAGTTDTGAVDPLNEIADVAGRHKAWLHIDAAYGGFFILTSKKDLFNGIEKADSIIIDPHKGLFISYGLGAVLIKDKNALLHTHAYSGHYMQDAAAEELIRSPANLSPELTRHFRGLRLWLPLQLHGLSPFVACLEEKLLLIQYFRKKLMALGFCVGPEPDLSISYFWYPFDKESNLKNKQLMDAIHDDGDAFLSSSIISGQYVIRIALLSFRTKKESVDDAVAMIERCLKKIK